MICLLDTNEDLDVCSDELGEECGQLLTPLTRFSLRDPSKPWAIDNGAFARFDERAFLTLLAREQHHADKCLFVTVPDIVGSARRTLELFERWASRLNGWTLALACQDGQEALPIPWDDIGAVFIGGSTQFKTSQDVLHIIKAAKALGKWAHVGRVNDPARYAFFEEAGADSCDGSGLARYSHMRHAISRRDNQGKLQCV